ncbi:ubiquitin carboxyl-terminal hydrolase-domain-containing protein [Paraphysoderma sedebokerense]|nr:ubiquitin carboxyl-terminal hydrolase-domain-containing protein [Paraphysoderma sedebokerense]KAI9141309.1 ubiquitin carboxyl-terminal hydrolase-domain-containing protein [Paraphysoderma sedebokerense]
MSDYFEINTYCNDTSYPITSLVFDTSQELLWIGNQDGRIRSVVPPRFERYTAFKGHHGATLQMLIDNRFGGGIISLAQDGVKFTNRRGIVKWMTTSKKLESIKRLHAMTFTSLRPTHELLVGGEQDNLILLNTDRGTVIKEFKDEYSQVAVLRRNARYIVGGTTKGHLAVRDPKTLKTEHVFPAAHTGMISDVDVMDNTVATCGFTQRKGQMVVDPFIKLYDLRMMKTMAALSFPNGPYLLKFHPHQSNKIYAVSQSGVLQVCNVKELSCSLPYQLNVTGYPTAIDVSSSGDMLAFGDYSGIVHLWSDKTDCKVNNLSDAIEVPSQHVPHAVSMDSDSPLNTVGVPFYSERLLSGNWPLYLTFSVGEPPARIDPSILETVKMYDFVGYAPKPKNIRRNQIGYGSKALKASPQFKSEIQKQIALGRTPQKDKGKLQAKDGNQTGRHASVPQSYRSVEIKYSKFGVEDFDFGYYNKTPFGGLETHIANSYINSFLQLLYFTPHLKHIVTSHLSGTCPNDHCLTCELGFLFKMLDDAKGLNCQATNFLKAFSYIPQASALGLFEPDNPDMQTSYSGLIQNFNRFILEQFHRETNQSTNPPLLKSPSYLSPTTQKPISELSVIQQLCGTNYIASSKCSQCQDTVDRDTTSFVIEIVYPPANRPKTPSSADSVRPSTTFESLLQLSLTREYQTKAWCSKCQKYQSTVQSKRMLSLPSMLNINCAANSDEALDVWRSKENHFVSDKKSKGFLPLRLAIFEQDGQIFVDDASQDYENENAENVAYYGLQAVISEIKYDKDLPHLVAQIRSTSDSDQSDSEWHLFNDFLVTPIPVHEVTQFPRSWKNPAVVQYVRSEIGNLYDMSQLTVEKDNSILFEELSISRPETRLPSLTKPLIEEELHPGYLCAIDAEFVSLSQEEAEIRSDGSKSLLRPTRLSLARVSVLRGESDMDCTPFIDDYIATIEPIADYLTEYSGIQPGDLDPALSKHTLVPLKLAYKKLRLLVDMGCKFIGHGLKKDFRIINILVPPHQIIDTVDIYFIPSKQRRLGLRFLAWYLLDIDIQQSSHDSIEDARTALLLYKKYLHYKEEGLFDTVLTDIYNAGVKYQWKPGVKPGQVPKTAKPDISTEATKEPSSSLDDSSNQISKNIPLSSPSPHSRQPFQLESQVTMPSQLPASSPSPRSPSSPSTRRQRQPRSQTAVPKPRTNQQRSPDTRQEVMNSPLELRRMRKKPQPSPAEISVEAAAFNPTVSVPPSSSAGASSAPSRAGSQETKRRTHMSSLGSSNYNSNNNNNNNRNSNAPMYPGVSRFGANSLDTVGFDQNTGRGGGRKRGSNRNTAGMDRRVPDWDNNAMNLSIAGGPSQDVRRSYRPPMVVGPPVYGLPSHMNQQHMGMPQPGFDYGGGEWVQNIPNFIGNEMERPPGNMYREATGPLGYNDPTFGGQFMPSQHEAAAGGNYYSRHQDASRAPPPGSLSHEQQGQWGYGRYDGGAGYTGGEVNQRKRGNGRR